MASPMQFNFLQTLSNFSGTATSGESTNINNFFKINGEGTEFQAMSFFEVLGSSIENNEVLTKSAQGNLMFDNESALLTQDGVANVSALEGKISPHLEEGQLFFDEKLDVIVEEITNSNDESPDLIFKLNKNQVLDTSLVNKPIASDYKLANIAVESFKSGSDKSLDPDSIVKSETVNKPGVVLNKDVLGQSKADLIGSTEALIKVGEKGALENKQAGELTSGLNPEKDKLSEMIKSQLNLGKDSPVKDSAVRDSSIKDSAIKDGAVKEITEKETSSFLKQNIRVSSADLTGIQSSKAGLTKNDSAASDLAFKLNEKNIEFEKLVSKKLADESQKPGIDANSKRDFSLAELVKGKNNTKQGDLIQQNKIADNDLLFSKMNGLKGQLSLLPKGSTMSIVKPILSDNNPSQVISTKLEAEPTFLSPIKTETIDGVDLLKPGPITEFSKGLSVKQNFTPNLAMRIQWMLNQSLSSAEIMMDPPEMGPMNVKIQQNNGETNIMFQVSHGVTKETLEDNLAKLREMLEQQGINLGEAVVQQQKRESEPGSDDNNLSENTSDISLNEASEDDNSILASQVDQILDVYS